MDTTPPTTPTKLTKRELSNVVSNSFKELIAEAYSDEWQRITEKNGVVISKKVVKGKLHIRYSALTKRISISRYERNGRRTSTPFRSSQSDTRRSTRYGMVKLYYFFSLY